MQILKQIQIPYSFAKDMAFCYVTKVIRHFYCATEDTARIALQEARRILGKSAHDQFVATIRISCPQFSYAGDTGESQQVAAGLEDHPDLLSLADQVPEAEDLMDQEDDAPIVRLINALLSEAIRVQRIRIFILKPLRKNFRYVYVSMVNCVKSYSHAVNLRRCWCHVLKSWRNWILQKSVFPQDGRISCVWQVVRSMCVYDLWYGYHGV